MEIRQQAAMFYGASRQGFENAHELRASMTDAEKALWERLRKNQLGVRFKPQHPVGCYIADFYAHAAKLVIEIDGNIHDEQKEYDADRTSVMEEFGLKIIRFSNDEVLNNIDDVIQRINENIKTPNKKGMSS